MDQCQGGLEGCNSQTGQMNPHLCDLICPISRHAPLLPLKLSIFSNLCLWSKHLPLSSGLSFGIQILL